MNYLVVENLSKTIFAKTLFDRVNFAIQKGDKVAIVAKNGSGKSTLLQILAGKTSYDDGSITIQKDLKISYLPQEPELNPESTIQEELFNSDSRLLKIVKEYEDSLANPSDEKRMQNALDAMNEANVWEYEADIHEILANLKLDNLDQQIKTFSGGQKKRLALAKVLIDETDLLMMDEPTNHLDLEMINWLENYLAAKDITLLLVTHDRYFLDRVCNQILEIDRSKIYKHKGNYEYFLDKQLSRRTNENIEIDKTKSLLRKELEYVRKQPQGRQSKSGARVRDYYLVKSNLGTKHSEEKVKLDVVHSRLGGKVLELHNIVKKYGDKIILDKFNYSFKKGEKIGIIGPNGAGKSTLLNLIMGQELPDSGKIVKGETVIFGYYSQYQTELNPNQKVIDAVKEIASIIKLSDGDEISASRMLEKFLFSPHDQQNLIGKLSGGEKKRIALLRILMKSPNFLILDEPTNDFDLMTLEVLEEFLKEFKGCLIIVSHDRYFMDSIVDHLFVFEGNGVIKDFPGNYSDYRARGEDITKPNPIIQTHTEVKVSSNEVHELYKEIQKLEKKKAKLVEKMYSLADDYEKIGEVSKLIEFVDKQIEEKNDRWLELSIN